MGSMRCPSVIKLSLVFAKKKKKKKLGRSIAVELVMFPVHVQHFYVPITTGGDSLQRNIYAQCRLILVSAQLRVFVLGTNTSLIK
jgi:hypothetical protein